MILLCFGIELKNPKGCHMTPLMPFSKPLQKTHIYYKSQQDGYLQILKWLALAQQNCPIKKTDH